MSFRNSFGNALQDATNQFFKIRGDRLDRERQTKLDAENKQIHDLQIQQMQMALADKPGDNAWQDAQRISEALGPEQAFNNPDYLAKLKIAGVNVHTTGTPGKYLMAAPDMANCEHGIGPDQVTPDTGVILPYKVQLGKAQQQQQMAEAQEFASILKSGSFDPNNPRHRYLLTKQSGVNANEVLGPMDTDPTMAKLDKRQRIIEQAKHDINPRAAGSDGELNSNQYATRLQTITAKAETDAAARYPMPGEGKDMESQIAGTLTGKELEDARAKVIAQRDKFVEQYIKQQMKVQNIKDPNAPVAPDSRLTIPSPLTAPSFDAPVAPAAPAGPTNDAAALLPKPVPKPAGANGMAPAPLTQAAPNRGQAAAGKSKYSGGVIGTASNQPGPTSQAGASGMPDWMKRILLMTADSGQ